MGQHEDTLKSQFKRLVPLAMKNETQAITELIHSTQSSLFKFCFLLGKNKEQAEDLCQETYIKAFSKLAQLKKAESFQSWLFQMAKNQFYDEQRSMKLQQQYQSEELMFLKITQLDANWDSILQVRKIISQFDTDEKTLLILIEIEGYSYNEAATFFKTTEDAIRSKIHRVRQEVAKKLKLSETN